MSKRSIQCGANQWQDMRTMRRAVKACDRKKERKRAYFRSRHGYRPWARQTGGGYGDDGVVQNRV